MKRYKSIQYINHLAVLCLLALHLTACLQSSVMEPTIHVDLFVDGSTIQLTLPYGSTVKQALDEAEVQLSESDRVEPEIYTTLFGSAAIHVIRVQERFEVEIEIIPFNQHTIRSETIPEGDRLLLQPGANGKQEITYRIVEESGQELSRTPVKWTILEEPVTEIVMLGAQFAYAPLPIEGTLAYLTNGNAWLMQGDSSNRRPLTLTGDLDGRVFHLSPDSRWLLYTRQSPSSSEDINSLWLIGTREANQEPIDLQVSNVIHFADWDPSRLSTRFAYSTVEPSPATPGWKANNDLLIANLTAYGNIFQKQRIIKENAGGQYGWWGTKYNWSPDGQSIAFARADSIGIIDLNDPTLEILYEFIPFQTPGNWAWVPDIAWGLDNDVIFTVDHGIPLGLEEPTASPIFHLTAIPVDGGDPLRFVNRTGMFASPSVSSTSLTMGGVEEWSLAYLQAYSPLKSDKSRYQLMVMDRDGSNREAIFPAPGEPGLTPQQVVWSPDGSMIALIYRDDLWVVDSSSGKGQQLTADGQTIAYDWKP